MEDSIFSDNKAREGAAICIEPLTLRYEKDIEHDNYIRNTIFVNNNSELRSAVLLSFDSGYLKIFNNTFENNLGIESSIFINSNAEIDITSNRFTGNGGSIISTSESTRSKVNLEENTFSSNLGQAISSQNAIIKDRKSKYLHNNSTESGS